MALRTFYSGFSINHINYVVQTYPTIIRSRCYVICPELGFAIFNTITLQALYVSPNLSSEAMAKITVCVKRIVKHPKFRFEDGVDNLLN